MEYCEKCCKEKLHKKVQKSYWGAARGNEKTAGNHTKPCMPKDAQGHAPEEKTMGLKRFFACCIIAALCCTGTVFAADKANLNTATEEELAADPKIGAELARKIVEYRENVGDFTKYEELREIEGMTDTKIKEINEHFEIEGVASFDCNC